MTMKNRVGVLAAAAATGGIVLLGLLIRDLSTASADGVGPGIGYSLLLGIGLLSLCAASVAGLKTIRSLLEILGGEPEDVTAAARNLASGNLSGHIILEPNDSASLLATIAHIQSDLRERRAAHVEDSSNASTLSAIGKAMATVEFSLDGSILNANGNFLQAVGYTLEEIRGRHHRMFVEPTEASSAAYQRFWENLRSGHYDAGQYRRLGKGGREVWLQASYNPILDSSGNPVKILKLASDITEQVRTTEDVRALANAATNGDLTTRIPTQGKSGYLLALSNAINSMVDGMAGIVAQIRGAVEGVRSGTEEISKGNSELSQRTEEQASSLEETASSMEEMTSTVRQNADNAAQANQLAAAARAQAEKGGAVVSEAVAAMRGINDASKKIADIIGVIDEIAFQTNLLALNAAVEAARAGEQGRGFAVVAAEVRTLASRSAAAAKEIKTLIQDSVAKVEHGSHLVGQSGQSLSDIVTAVKKATDIVAEIAAACQEQASGIDQVNRAVGSLDQVTQQNAALVEEAASAAEALSEEAQRLESLMAKYKIGEQAAHSQTSSQARMSRPKLVTQSPERRKGAPSPGGTVTSLRSSGPPMSGRTSAQAAAAEWAEF